MGFILLNKLKCIKQIDYLGSIKYVDFFWYKKVEDDIMDKKLLFIMKKEVIYLIFYHQSMVGKWQFLWRHLRNPGSSGSEGSVDAGMNGIVAETSVEKPKKFTFKKMFYPVNILLVMGLGNDGGQGGGGPLPGQHLVLDLADLLLQVPGGGVHGLPDADQ